MKTFILTCYFLSAFFNLTLAAETINSIDRNALFEKYVAPEYKVSINEIQNLNLEQAQNFLITDIYNFIMKVQDDYIVKNKSPLQLFYPKITMMKVNDAVLTHLTSKELMTEENINTKVNSDIKEHLKMIHDMNQEPSYSTISNLYYEVISLKEQIKSLKENVNDKKTPTVNLPQKESPESSMNIEDMALKFGPILFSLIAIFLARKSQNKKTSAK